MDLIAQGKKATHRWRRRVPESGTFTLGRTSHGWSVAWDDHISRNHVELSEIDGALSISRLPTARNPVFVEGREVQQTTIRAGGHFVIGGTTFTITNTQALVTADQPLPASQKKYSAKYLREIRYRDADKRIDVLSRLPDLIQGAASDRELFSRVVSVLLTGVPDCNAAAIVAASGDDHDRVEVLHWDSSRATQSDFHPSQRLIRQALHGGESVIHLWTGQVGSSTAYTQREDMDWAFCTPVPGKQCEGWTLYISGGFAPDDATANHDDFRDDLKFAESAAATLGNLQDVKQLERGNAALSQFFSPLVLEVLAVEDPEVVLAPKEANISVMFCDLRGFSLHAEQSADNLFGLLDRVSEALGVMTRLILDQSGVVGDFQGDSVMGFWGWPLPQADAALRACHAALAICHELEQAKESANHPLSHFGFGIGLATGTAVAGKIGTLDQFKVTVFGPVVNLASRLEGMTKQLQAPILMDEATAQTVRDSLSCDRGRVRPLCPVQPFGMNQTVTVSQLILSEADYPQVSTEQIAATSKCFAAMRDGDWDEARCWRDTLSSSDGVRSFIDEFIASESPKSPDGWDGNIRMGSK